MDELIERFAAEVGRDLILRAGDQPSGDRSHGHPLPEDARIFFERVVGGHFVLPPRQKFYLYDDPFGANINQMFDAPELPGVFPYYDQCFLFVWFELNGFSFGIDLNAERYGSIFGYEDQCLGVSVKSYYMFPSIRDMLLEFTSLREGEAPGITLKDRRPVLSLEHRSMGSHLY